MLSSIDISIHAAREGGDAIAILPSATSSISIHAAREGGDGFDNPKEEVETVISIHAAREGGDNSAIGLCRNFVTFQSTPPVKAAT